MSEILREVPPEFAHRNMLSYMCPHCGWHVTMSGGEPGVRIVGREGIYCPACFERAGIPKLDVKG